LSIRREATPKFGYLKQNLVGFSLYTVLPTVKFINMTRFETVNLIGIYETNGTENKELKSKMPKLIVSEHWNRKQFVVIEIEGVKHTVLADELKRAIDNSQNAHSH